MKNYEIGKTHFNSFIILSLIILFKKVVKPHQVSRYESRIIFYFWSTWLLKSTTNSTASLREFSLNFENVCHSMVLTYCKSSCLEIFTGVYRVSSYRSRIFLFLISIQGRVNHEFDGFDIVELTRRYPYLTNSNLKKKKKKKTQLLDESKKMS